MAVPVIQGFPLFGEARPLGGVGSETWWQSLREKVLDPHGEYEAFLDKKVSRGHAEPYAAFQPFNESTRSLYPLLPLLKEVLQPGDIILDTWCRTGWSGELLAGLFPEQQVISIWEGNSNVLGYRGFAYWLASERRLPNLEIIFTHPDRALPLADNSVRVIHGLDSLHRYQHTSFIPECLRVCEKEGLLIFPHNHLSNSEPDPFFQRGCHQYHGREWKSWLDKILADSDRRGWILSEAALFKPENDYQLSDQSDTPHYNGLVLIANRDNEGRKLAPCPFPALSGQSRLVPNSLVRFNLHQCEVAINPDGLAGMVPEMLERHPCYAQKLTKVLGDRLTTDEARLIWHARQGLDVQSIATHMEFQPEQVEQLATGLCQRELLHPAIVSDAMAALQNFYSFAKLPGKEPARFSEIWQTALAGYDQRPVLCWLEDDSRLELDDVVYLVNAIRVQLVKEGLKSGSRIAMVSGHHPEALLLCWAAWLQGIVTILLDDSLPAEQIGDSLSRSKAELLFSDRSSLVQALTVKTVVLDTDDTPVALSFSNWLEQSLGLAPDDVSVDPDSPAVVLFTSGSSGEPKGVVLSQRALCVSARTMAQTHGWHAETLMSLGPLSMMSGLRNPAAAALVSESTILVPGRKTIQLALNAWLQAGSMGATVITGVPAWLNSLMRVRDRLEPAPGLKQILLTGTHLEAHQQIEARQRLGLTVGNYYGLTETGGICTAALDEADFGTLGRPVNALLQIVNPDGQPVVAGEVGRLRVHSSQLMSGYLDDPAATAKVLQHGWLLTGDLAHWDDQGRLVLDGREDELLKLRNGARFHPHELEALLTSIPDVDAAAVTIDAEHGRLVALIVGKSDPAEVRKQLAPSVAPHLIPDLILNVEELPIGSNGKLQRSQLASLV